MKILLFISLVFVSACTDTQVASFKAIGSPGHITCFSGGKEIFDGESTGRIQTVTNSDGWEFKDFKTGQFIRISGDCVIRN